MAKKGEWASKTELNSIDWLIDQLIDTQRNDRWGTFLSQ